MFFKLGKEQIQMGNNKLEAIKQVKKACFTRCLFKVIDMSKAKKNIFSVNYHIPRDVKENLDKYC